LFWKHQNKHRVSSSNNKQTKNDITGCPWCITDGGVKFQSNCSIHYFDFYIIPIQFNTNTSTGYNWPFKHIKNTQNDILNMYYIYIYIY
jgi:SET domain-containing protein